MPTSGKQVATERKPLDNILTDDDCNYTQEPVAAVNTTPEAEAVGCVRAAFYNISEEAVR